MVEKRGIYLSKKSYSEINIYNNNIFNNNNITVMVMLCWDFMAQSTQWGRVDRDQFT